MRRLLAFGLLLLLVGQSSGVAWAGSAQAMPSGSDVAGLIASAQSSIVSSRAYAYLTGAGARYDALHAPAPVMNRSQSPVDAAGLMRTRQAFEPRLRHGIRHPFVMPALSTVDRRHPRLDPLAMRRVGAATE